MTSQNPYPRTLTGLCIGVLSGDRVVFHGPVAKDTGLPVQKVLHLSSLSTPKVDLAGGNDEPFGYASRQYLRSRLVGKQVQFTLETKVGEIELGHVVYDGQDISIGLLREGLAKIRGDRAKGKNAEDYTTAEEKARKEHKNLWSEKPEKEALYSRRLTDRPLKNLAEELQAKPSTAIVEEIHPSNFTLYFPQLKFIAQISSPELHVVVLSEKKQNGETKNNAREIRTVLQGRVLNKEVQVVVKGHTPEGLTGYIKLDNFESRKFMLTFGYAKLSKEALNILDVTEFKDLKAISQEAASKGRGLWKEHKDTSNKTQTLQQTFIGKVVEVLSGDSLKVINLETNEAFRIYLSNAKAPPLGKPYAFEAKQTLRKRTIGKKVKVDIEFSKNIPVKKEDKTEERNFVFATVFENGKNIGASLIEDGLVSLQVPRAEDEFTKYFDELKIADEEAKKKKKGLHGNEHIRIPVFNDITSGKQGKYKVDIAKSKTIFSFLKDEKRLTGVVDFVLNGSRLKIRMHQQSCFIILVIEGIRCLPNEGEYKKWSQEAMEFSKENVSQRDVEIELSKVDKKGIFHGNVYIDKKNYALDLLERGLAINFGRSNAKYEEFESIAKKNKVGLWSQPINLSAFKGEEEKEYTPVNFTKTLRMAEVISPTEFYFDVANAKKPEVPQKPEPAKEIKQGELYAVKFTSDGVFYRARVKKALKNGQFHVSYIDYGNQQTVPAANFGLLEKHLKDAKSSLTKCGLYGIDNLSNSTTALLQELIDADFKVEFKEESNGQYNVIIQDKEGTINEEVIAEGLGECTAEIPAWQQLEKNAKAGRRGIWQGNDD